MDEGAFYAGLRARFEDSIVAKLIPVVGSSDELSRWINLLSYLIAAPPTTNIPVLSDNYQTQWTTSVSVPPVSLTRSFNILYQNYLILCA